MSQTSGWLSDKYGSALAYTQWRQQHEKLEYQITLICHLKGTESQKSVCVHNFSLIQSSVSLRHSWPLQPNSLDLFSVRNENPVIIICCCRCHRLTDSALRAFRAHTKTVVFFSHFSSLPTCARCLFSSRQKMPSVRCVCVCVCVFCVCLVPPR